MIKLKYIQFMNIEKLLELIKIMQIDMKNKYLDTQTTPIIII